MISEPRPSRTPVFAIAPVILAIHNPGDSQTANPSQFSPCSRKIPRLECVHSASSSWPFRPRGAVRAAAQAPPSSVIAEIHQTGSNHYADAQVAAASGLKPGDTVTLEQLQAAADRLAQLGIFSKVNYRFTTRGDKIVLEFQLADAPTVPVTFDNFPWFTDEELSAAIRQELPFFDGSAPQDGALLDTITAAISKLLEAHGISGSVQHTLLAQPSSNDMTVQFHLDGPSLTIASLDYGDTLAQSSTELAERKNDLLNKPFSRFAIDCSSSSRSARSISPPAICAYNFAAPIVRFAGDPNQPPASNVSVQIPIDPGPVFHFRV